MNNIVLYDIPKSIIRKSDEYVNSRIVPYKIHQTFKTTKVPINMYNAVRSWIDKNINYNYYFYDDNDIDEIIKEYDCEGMDINREQLLYAYNKMNTGAGKADIFRYLILYKEGGCYFDIDTKCVNKLDGFIEEDDELVSGIGREGDLHQWGMIYKRKHAFVKRALELSVYNIIHKRFINTRSLVGLTGPVCLDTAIKMVGNIPQRSVFKSGKYKVNGYVFHILKGDYFGNNVIFKYAGYERDLELLRMTHWGKGGIKGIFKS